MNPLQRALIEKTGHDFGFEYVLAESADIATLASARHPVQVQISMHGDNYHVEVVKGSGLLRSELARDFASDGGNVFKLVNQKHLAGFIKRAASLGRSLPNTVQLDFDRKVKSELEHLAQTVQSTEIERMVRQRVGQQTFRQAMLDYWGGACAVTGIALPGLLRASHAKPWAECASDAERLDVFNGFLLSANLDALFDRFLITFSEDGDLIVSPIIDEDIWTQLGLNKSHRLRWLVEEHQPYLQFHRDKFKTTKIKGQ